jgi:hypothetical protein
MNENTYNGWKNYETWNVALYIQNEYNLYTLAKRCKNYSDFLRYSWPDRHAATPDGVRWKSRKVCRTEINSMLREL